MTTGCTIIARNYLAYARLLTEAWSRSQPGRLRVLVTDADPGFREDGLDVLDPTALGLTAADVAVLRGIYDPAELTGALKARLLRHVLDEDGDVAMYVDPDFDVHASLEHVAGLAREHGTVLSPNFLRPLPIDGLSPSEVDMLWFGSYNSGFLAVSEGGRPFLDWWAARGRLDSLRAEPAGMHADQRWLDYVPSAFAHTILRDPAVNVAQWNLHERALGYRDGAFTIDDGPLRAFHFSGYDPASPRILDPAPWTRPLRFAVEPGSALERLCVDYGERLVAAGHAETRTVPYGYAASAAGTRLGRWERRAYRELVIAGEALGVEVPGPFDAARSDEFERYVAAPERSPMLSAGAKRRLLCQRVAATGGRARLRAAGRLAGMSRTALRRLVTSGDGWSPHPETSDRTRLEYRTA